MYEGSGKKCLITGGAGFIGQSLYKKVQKSRTQKEELRNEVF